MHLLETMVPGEWRVGGVPVSPEWHVPLQGPRPEINGRRELGRHSDDGRIRARRANLAARRYGILGEWIQPREIAPQRWPDCGGCAVKTFLECELTAWLKPLP